MKKFEFTLSDRDSVNLLTILNQCEYEAEQSAKDLYMKPTSSEVDRMNAELSISRSKYVKELTTKIFKGMATVD